MCVNPYRVDSAARAAEKVHLLPDDDAAESACLRIWAYSDGTTRLRVWPKPPWVTVLRLVGGCLILGVLAVAQLWEPRRLEDWLYGSLCLAAGFVVSWRLAWSLFGGERYSVGRAALIRRHRLIPWRRSEIYLLDEISTVVVSRGAEGERMDLQLGRRRVELCTGLDHRGENLRWIAQRLRRAIDDARAAGTNG